MTIHFISGEESALFRPLTISRRPLSATVSFMPLASVKAECPGLFTPEQAAASFSVSYVGRATIP